MQYIYAYRGFWLALHELTSKMAVVEKEKVLVTGAGGFVASWVVKTLLSNGYSVNGTVRQPEDDKHSHLHKLQRESDEKLKLFKADLLDYDSLISAVQGCVGVFHVASPILSPNVQDPEKEVMDPAVKGTENVLKACVEGKVKRVVHVSSTVAVTVNPKWPKDKVMDETCWSDQQFCKSMKRWYYLAKTQGESEAFEFSRRTGLELVSLCPSIILGPVLQSWPNQSSLFLVDFLQVTEGHKTVQNRPFPMVDVRDVADALLMVYEKPQAQGRYICTAHPLKTSDLVEKLKLLNPRYDYPNNFINKTEYDQFKLSSMKLQSLGWTYRPLEETLVDSVLSYRAAGFLDAAK